MYTCRLRAVLISSACVIEDSIDLTLIKHNDLSPFPPAVPEMANERKPDPNAKSEQRAQQIPSPALTTSVKQNTDQCKSQVHTEGPVQLHKNMCDQSTQTDSEQSNVAEPASNDNGLGVDPHLYQNVRVKEEPKPIQVKVEEEDLPEDGFYPELPSDGSEDDMSLIQFKKKKSPKSLKKNGQVQKKKKKSKMQDWDMLMRALPEGTALTVVDNSESSMKMEVEVKQERLDGSKTVKSEPVEYHCCICFVQCYSRNEMLQHYK